MRLVWGFTAHRLQTSKSNIPARHRARIISFFLIATIVFLVLLNVKASNLRHFPEYYQNDQSMEQKVERNEERKILDSTMVEGENEQGKHKDADIEGTILKLDQEMQVSTRRYGENLKKLQNELKNAEDKLTKLLSKDKGANPYINEEPAYCLGGAGYSWGPFTTGPETGCERRCTFGMDYNQAKSAAAIIGTPMSDRIAKQPGQKMFAFSLESPANFGVWASEERMKKFDFTLHYRYDADVPLLGQVGDFMPHPNPLTSLPDFNGLPWISYEDRLNKPIISIVISNCAGRNGRDQVIERLLATNITVASYGNCHNNARIPSGDSLPKDPVAARFITQGDKFRQKEGIVAMHLFHFAAENSDCDYYHTEKIYQALRSGAVPVYMGGKTITDFVPPGSIVDMRDFETPEDLSVYLQAVAANKNLYMQFHAWRLRPLPDFIKEKLEIAKMERTPKWYCDICKLVRGPDRPPARPDISCETNRF